MSKVGGHGKKEIHIDMTKLSFFRRHRRPFCPTDALVVGSTPFAFDERRAIRVVQVQGSGKKEKERKK